MPSVSLRTSTQPVVYSHDLNGYRRGCRCDVCRAANTARVARSRADRMKRQIHDQVTHGAACYNNWGCRCDVCTAAWTEACRAPSAKWKKEHPEKAGARIHARNEKSRKSATRHGYQWTGPELELAARLDLTTAQVAVMTGRTLAAVRNMRRKLREDPKIINLAGISAA